MGGGHGPTLCPRGESPRTFSPYAPSRGTSDELERGESRENRLSLTHHLVNEFASRYEFVDGADHLTGRVALTTGIDARRCFVTAEVERALFVRHEELVGKLL